MRVGVIYLHVARQGYPEAPLPEFYAPFHRGFVDTYREFDAGYEHHLRVVWCGGEPVGPERDMYAGIAHSFSEYLGAGADIGAQQFTMREFDYDFVVNLATPVSFWKSGWLRRLVEAREKHGDGLYGPFGSWEWYPHIRTSAWAVDRKTFLVYPQEIDTRAKTFIFEHRGGTLEFPQLTFWYAGLGKPAMQVTWGGEQLPHEWRAGANIMFRGDQSECLLHDRYTRYFATLSDADKQVKDLQVTSNEPNPRNG